MAKKLLCIVLSVAMLLGTFAIASSAVCSFMSEEDAAAILESKEWEEAYNAGVDYKDLINRKWLTGYPQEEYGIYASLPDVAAPEAILEENLSFWADEIIDAYNAASTNEEFWTLYNKMNTPNVVEYYCPYCEETEYDVLIDYGYEYRAENKATMELELVADKQYVKAGDTITVDVFATSNFYTAELYGGVFYNKQYLECTSVAFDTTAHPTWVESDAQTSAYATEEAKMRSWPKNMLNEEDMAKYGVAYIAAVPDNGLGFGNYEGAVKYNGERLMTITFTVKADVTEGTEIDLLVPAGLTLTMDDVLYLDMYERDSMWRFLHVVYPDSTEDKLFVTVGNDASLGQTVTAEPLKLIVGDEPAEEPDEPVVPDVPAVKGEIVDVYLAESFVGETTPVDIEVTGTPDSLRIATADGYLTFSREDATIIDFNGNELWTVELFVSEAISTYTVYADYGDLGVTDGKDFTIVAEVKKDLGVYSIEIPDMYPNAQNGGVITAGKHDVIIKTSTDVVKIQFYAEDGSTYTYTSWSGAGKVPFEDVDGVRTWTISHAFGPFGTSSLVIRTRSETTFFAATNATLDATVVY